MEIPFVFDNLEHGKNMIGGSKEAQPLADYMSNAWINFARNGNPNPKNNSDWPAYTSKNTLTMYFDTISIVKPQQDKELLELLTN